MLTIEEIAKRLKACNISQASRDLYVTRTYLSAIANGRLQPGNNMRARLSDYLKERADV